MCPRTIYPDIAGRSEFGRTGTYVLVGQGEDGSGGSRVYIGESDNVRTRMKDHELKKTFWDELVVITKTDGSLHKADVRYLEARLFELAVRSPLAVMENVKNPTPPQPTEAHKADLDSFLDDVLPILRLLGVSAFSDGPSPTTVPTSLIPPVPAVPASPIALTGGPPVPKTIASSSVRRRSTSCTGWPCTSATASVNSAVASRNATDSATVSGRATADLPMGAAATAPMAAPVPVTVATYFFSSAATIPAGVAPGCRRCIRRTWLATTECWTQMALSTLSVSSMFHLQFGTGG